MKLLGRFCFSFLCYWYLNVGTIVCTAVKIFQLSSKYECRMAECAYFVQWHIGFVRKSTSIFSHAHVHSISESVRNRVIISVINVIWNQFCSVYLIVVVFLSE